MENDLTYLAMMTDILNKKKNLLNELLDCTKEQEKLIKGDDFDEDEFNKIIDRKAELIGKIDEGDDGFQAVYNRMAKELKENTSKYGQQVEELKQLITSVTELSVSVEALEKKNRTALENYFRSRRKDRKQFKVNKQTADKYYKNMMGTQSNRSYFLDEQN